MTDNFLASFGKSDRRQMTAYSVDKKDKKMY